jgi:hypothetical protein
MGEQSLFGDHFKFTILGNPFANRFMPVILQWPPIENLSKLNGILPRRFKRLTEIHFIFAGSGFLKHPIPPI